MSLTRPSTVESALQSEVEYEYFADRFSVRCQSSFNKVLSYLQRWISPLNALCAHRVLHNFVPDPKFCMIHAVVTAFIYMWSVFFVLQLLRDDS